MHSRFCGSRMSLLEDHCPSIGTALAWSGRGGSRGAGGWRRRGVAWLAGRVAEEAEEFGIRLEQHARVVGAQTRLIGLHRSIEGEELRIAAECLGEDPITLGIALAADLLTLRLRLRLQHGDIAIRPGADLLCSLQAERAELLRLALALGDHPLVDGLAVLLRQIGP